MQKRVSRIVFVSLLLAGIIAVSITTAVGIGLYLSPRNALKPVDAVVVISGGGNERIAHGAMLVTEGFAPVLIVSGAAREGEYSNAQAMKAIAVESFGIDPAQIITDDDSHNTFENAQNVGRIIQEHSLHRIMLVTSAYHQRRAYLTFKHVLGSEVQITNAPAEVSFWTPYGWWLDEKGRTLTLTEFVKVLWSSLTGQYA